MLQQSSQAIPIYPGTMAQLSSNPYTFGTTPWRQTGLRESSGTFLDGYHSGLSGCGCGSYGGCGCSPVTMSGLGRGGGGHGVTGMGGRGMNGLAGLGQTPSWVDQIAIAAGNWLASITHQPIQVGPTGVGYPSIQPYRPPGISDYLPLIAGVLLVSKLLK